MAYRAGKTLFYAITVRKVFATNTFTDIFARGTFTPTRDLSAFEVSEFLIRHTLDSSAFKHLANEEVSVAAYHIERN